MNEDDFKPIPPPIYSLEDFPDFKWLASQYLVVLEELKKNTLWMNWGSDDYDPLGHCEFLKGAWTICPLYFGDCNPYGMNWGDMSLKDLEALLDTLPSRFPETHKLLQKISTIKYAAFSRLHSKSKLAEHRHFNMSSLIFHLGLVIPHGDCCGLRVDEHTHIWSKAGDAIIFNDNFQHSAWNDSDEERIILYVDFRPQTKKGPSKA